MSRRALRLRICTLLVALAAAITSGCDAFSPTKEIAGAIAIPPQPDFAQWWTDVENCSGITGDVARVSWYVVPDVETFHYRDGDYFGYWWSSHDIVIAGAHLSDSMVVRHEMLHDLLNTADHPTEYFLYKCSGVVDFR
jgi:hypothetical protein